VFVHPHDPYHRTDVLRSSRHVQVVVDGQAVAESRRPVPLFETGLPERYYRHADGGRRRGQAGRLAPVPELRRDVRVQRGADGSRTPALKPDLSRARVPEDRSAPTSGPFRGHGPLSPAPGRVEGAFHGREEAITLRAPCRLCAHDPVGPSAHGLRQPGKVQERSKLWSLDRILARLLRLRTGVGLETPGPYLR
jgi:hypothetical protein